ncbi:MAG: septum formation inhibitor Maf, partial [Flavobacteriaceae bacterium]|nr:septum formation inhibitor Maf [Flavobacteriaceae bacterium]
MKNLIFVSLSLFVLSCTQSENTERDKRTLEKRFGSYWYSGQAEITAYTLEQSQYGAPRKGDAVLIYVTEDFNPNTQVKAERRSKETVSVLKLNATKRFYTGIYPYNIMQSTFSPINTQEHALKTSVSIQEWCGHVYAQINNREELEYSSHSYFENEADQQIRLPKVFMENDLWNLIRINPLELPTGNFKAIPSLESIKLMHLDKQVFEASASLHQEKGSYHYTLHYPE